MAQRKQINIRLGDDEFAAKIAALRRYMVLDNPAIIPTTADVLRAAVDRMFDDVNRKSRKRVEQ